MVGKWHLGDKKELRPSSRGFDEVYQHGGGGIGQAHDFPGNSYNNPAILHNEKIIETKGYCTDLFFDHAISWMKKQTQPLQIWPDTKGPFRAGNPGTAEALFRF